MPRSPLEKRVWEAFADGSAVDVRPRPRPSDDLRRGADWSVERQLRAEFLVDLLTGCDTPQPAGVSALRLAGVAVVGELGLEAADVPYLVELTDCWFSHRPDLRMARLTGLRLTGCRLPGFRGRNLAVDSDLVLEAGFTADGQVDLSDAHIDGSLRLSGAVLRRPGGTALLAERMVVAGAIQAGVLRATGAVRIPNSRVGGNIDVSGARLSNPDGEALHAEGIEVSGSVLGELKGGRLVANGRVVLSGARIGGDLRLSGAQLAVAPPAERSGLVVPRGTADDASASLVADRISVRGNLDLDDGFCAVGAVRLPAANIGGHLRLSGATLGRPERLPETEGDRLARIPVALVADGIRVGGDLDARAGGGPADRGREGPLTAYGQLRLVDGEVRGSASLSGIRLHGAGIDVLFADRLTVGGTLFMRGARVAGSIRLQNAHIGSTLDCTGAELTAPRYRPDGSPKPSLDARVASIGKDVLCSRGFRATGGVRLRRVEVGKSTNFELARLGGETGAVALNAFGLSTQELNVRFAEVPNGDVILTAARAVSVSDSAAFWHTRGTVDLEDFTYQSLTARPDVSVRTRLNWLRTVLPEYDPDPYEQLAAMYAGAGREERSRQVLLMNQRRRHAAMRLPGRALGWIQEVTVGYGYRPMLALIWFLGAWGLGAYWFTEHYTPGLIDPEHQPVFNGTLFALDTLLPIVNLGQDEHWRTAGASQWIAAALTLVGWVLASTAAAGVARVLRKP
ncbi:MAG TPA: hypothetical protein VGD67_06410 [Pseudonocardiaceae bacterium]